MRGFPMLAGCVSMQSALWHSLLTAGPGLLIAGLGVFANACAALPLITALGLVVGRRGNARHCLWGSRRLLALCLIFCASGPAYYLAGYFSHILPLATSAENIMRPLFSPGGAPYSSSILMWLAGCICLCAASLALFRVFAAFDEPSDRYSLAIIKTPLFFCLAAALCFFATFILINWPFAGIPQQLTWDRAIMAICRNAARHYFMAFCPAGALALIFAFSSFRAYPAFMAKQASPSIRWLAVWAAIGYLPYSLQTWGLVIGLGLRGNLSGNLAQGMYAQVVALCFTTMAIACWAWLALDKKPKKFLVYMGFIFLLLRESTPFLIKLYSSTE